MEDVFWGWNNEVHIFDPGQASWNEPKTNVSQRKKGFGIKFHFRNQFPKSCEDFSVTCFVFRVALLPPGLPMPAPHLDTEDMFVEVESW